MIRRVVFATLVVSSAGRLLLDPAALAAGAPARPKLNEFEQAGLAAKASLATCRKLEDKKQYREALACALPLAKAGDAAAATYVGSLYAYDDTPIHNELESRSWFKFAAKRGDGEACYRLGLDFTSKDDSASRREGVAWLKLGTEAGDLKAMYALALQYAVGDNVELDLAESVRLREMAAEGGLADAQSDLAQLYLYGDDGVPEDHYAAYRWYLKAANQDDWFSMGQVAEMLGKGDGTERNVYQAMERYYKLCSEYLDAVQKEPNNGPIRELALGVIGKMDDLVPQHPLTSRLLGRLYGEPSASAKGHAQPKSPPVSLGTGWVVAPGILVTAYHVVANAKQMEVLFADGKSTDAALAQADKANDIAVLRAAGTARLTHSLPVSTAGAAPGSSVLALGFPHPEIMGSNPKVSLGNISSTTGLGDDPRFYQVTAPVQSGNSGGPLLNMRGEVVGIVAAKLDAVKVLGLTGDLPENVNFAVKVDYLRPLLNMLGVHDGEVTRADSGARSPEDIASQATPSVVLIRAQ